MKTGKHEKLVRNLYRQKNYIIHIRSLRYAMNHGLISTIKSTRSNIIQQGSLVEAMH